MSYFDCFVVGAWMFAIGWFLGAIYVQNRTEGTQTSRVADETRRARVTEIPEPCPDCHEWGLPVQTGSGAAAD
jgi:hypothetical protein